MLPFSSSLSKNYEQQTKSLLNSGRTADILVNVNTSVNGVKTPLVDEYVRCYDKDTDEDDFMGAGFTDKNGNVRITTRVGMNTPILTAILMVRMEGLSLVFIGIGINLTPRVLISLCLQETNEI